MHGVERLLMFTTELKHVAVLKAYSRAADCIIYDNECKVQYRAVATKCNINILHDIIKTIKSCVEEEGGIPRIVP